MELVITCICPDLSQLHENTITEAIKKFPSSDIIVFPEHLLELTPEPKEAFNNQLIFMGSETDLNFNKTKISLNGDFLSYSKQKLTPRESDLKPGNENICIHFKGVKIGLAVCFDIEYPELVPDWRNDDLDLLVVPSATETVLGYERVNRCASARSVELGCAVVTSHLIGNTNHKIAHTHVGDHHLHLPSQSIFQDDQRYPELKPISQGELVRQYTLNIDKIRGQKDIKDETNPAL